MNQLAPQAELASDSIGSNVAMPAGASLVCIDDAWLKQAQWRIYMQWLSGALLVHILVLIAIFMGDTAPATAPQTMQVSLLPMAPAANTPPAPAAKSEPVVKKTNTKTVTEKTSQAKPTEASISQPQSAASAGQTSNSQQAASGSEKASQDLPITAAHNAAYLNNPKPAYPAMSRRLGEQGTVILEVHVLPSGSPEKVEIAKSSGFPRLDEAGRDVILKYWRFEPARRGGEAIAQTVKIPMPFILEK